MKCSIGNTQACRCSRVEHNVAFSELSKARQHWRPQSLVREGWCLFPMSRMWRRTWYCGHFSRRRNRMECRRIRRSGRLMRKRDGFQGLISGIRSFWVRRVICICFGRKRWCLSRKWNPAIRFGGMLAYISLPSSTYDVLLILTSYAMLWRPHTMALILRVWFISLLHRRPSSILLISDSIGKILLLAFRLRITSILTELGLS
jgi:hypothetical protein